MSLSLFPSINAALNGTSAAFLILGFFYIQQKKIPQHKICMVTATICSVLFLICYLYYHFHHGSTGFKKEGWIRPVYFSILISHTILAMVNLPMILKTLWHVLKGDFEKHKKIARYTFPIWLYVSITGVVIYFMLYRM